MVAVAPERPATGARRPTGGVLVAHQPPYLPHPAFLDKVARADIWVVQDDLQYAKQEWQNRNRIRTAGGWRWLTIPVHAGSRTPIDAVRVADPRWAPRHRRILEQHYSRSPFLARLEPLFGAAARATEPRLADVALATTQALMAAFGIATPVVRASELELPEEDHLDPTRRLIALCRRLSCGTYISGAGGRDYLDVAAMHRAGIEPRWQRFELPPYEQLHTGFVPGLSAVDLLLCHPDPAAQLARGRLACAEA